MAISYDLMINIQTQRNQLQHALKDMSRNADDIEKKVTGAYNAGGKYGNSIKDALRYHVMTSNQLSDIQKKHMTSEELQKSQIKHLRETLRMAEKSNEFSDKELEKMRKKLHLAEEYNDKIEEGISILSTMTGYIAGKLVGAWQMLNDAVDAAISHQKHFVTATYETIGGMHMMVQQVNSLQMSLGLTDEEALNVAKALADVGMVLDSGVDGIQNYMRINAIFAKRLGVNNDTLAVFQRRLTSSHRTLKEVEHALGLAAAAQRIYNLSSRDTDSVISTLNSTLKDVELLYGASKIDEYTTDMLKMAGAAKKAGVGVEEANALMAKMASDPFAFLAAGVSPEMDPSERIRALSKRVSEQYDAMTRSGRSAISMQVYFKEVLGLTASQVMLLREAHKELGRELTEAETASMAYSKAWGTLSDNIDVIRNKLYGIAKTAVTPLVSIATDFLNAFNEPLKSTINMFDYVGKAVNDVLKSIRGPMESFRKRLFGFMTEDGKRVAGAIDPLIGAFDKFNAMIGKIADRTKAWLGTKLVSVISRATGALLDMVGKQADFIDDLADRIDKWIEEGNLEKWFARIEVWTKNFGTWMESMGNRFSDTMHVIRNWLGGMDIGGTVNTWIGYFRGFVNFIDKHVIAAIFNFIDSFVSTGEIDVWIAKLKIGFYSVLTVLAPIVDEIGRVAAGIQMVVGYTLRAKAIVSDNMLEMHRANKLIEEANESLSNSENLTSKYGQKALNIYQEELQLAKQNVEVKKQANAAAGEYLRRAADTGISLEKRIAILQNRIDQLNNVDYESIGVNKRLIEYYKKKDDLQKIALERELSKLQREKEGTKELDKQAGYMEKVAKAAEKKAMHDKTSSEEISKVADEYNRIKNAKYDVKSPEKALAQIRDVQGFDIKSKEEFAKRSKALIGPDLNKAYEQYVRGSLGQFRGVNENVSEEIMRQRMQKFIEIGGDLGKLTKVETAVVSKGRVPADTIVPSSVSADIKDSSRDIGKAVSDSVEKAVGDSTTAVSGLLTEVTALLSNIKETMSSNLSTIADNTSSDNISGMSLNRY